MGSGSRPATADVNKPIFIGGGGEGYLVVGLDLTEAVEPYIKLRKGGGNFYTHWDNRKAANTLRATYAAGRPVILIGHSWGGSNAISLALWARGNEITVDLLITIDPVGQPNYLIWTTGTYRGIARHWVTVIADKPGIQEGDAVARAWGKTPTAIQNFANCIIRDANAGHADFPTMMQTARAEALIATVYGAKRR